LRAIASAVAEPADRLGWLSDAPPPPLRQVVMAPAPSFTQGELAIIEEQRRAMQPLPRPVPPPAEAAPPEPPAARPSWVEVLKAYAEHLTDAELSILRQQYEH